VEGVISQGPLFIACLVFLMGIVIVVHELGHYFAGRLFNVAAESFAVGFGKPLFEVRDKRGTRWRLNWIPLGGFVAFVDKRSLEDAAPEASAPVGVAFDDVGPLKKIVISLAGPFANFVLAAAIFALALGVHGVAVQPVRVAATLEGMPAQEAGVLEGDQILKVDGQPIRNTSDFISAILLSPNEPVDLTIDRQGTERVISVTPVEVLRENPFGQMTRQSTVGLSIAPAAETARIRYGPLESVLAGVQQTGSSLDQTVKMLGSIVTGKMSFNSLSGPVGVADVSRRIVNNAMDRPDVPLSKRLNYLFWMLLSLCAAISVGVGFFNLLPLPVLDGGRVVFHAYEAVIGSKMPSQVEAMALRVGVLVLVAMVIVITWGDILETGVFGRGTS
jgi:regulator of sigma E protease